MDDVASIKDVCIYSVCLIKVVLKENKVVLYKWRVDTL